jgi:diadenosine tetraphosphatase ApaH/serine/threonine PP2A family protein phosphatase
MLAIVYDIHGNLPALEAVLADALTARDERFLLGGDYGLFGPFPADTVARLEELPAATWIRGNAERWSAHPEDAPEDPLIAEAIAACRNALGAQRIERLDGLPAQLVLEETRYCHGSPISDVRSFAPEPASEDDELLGGVAERRVVFGHTHLQFRRRLDDRIELINPGSAGMPFDGDPRAAYALVHEDGSLEHRRVPYDHEASAAAMLERFGDVPWARRSADRLLRARA